MAVIRVLTATGFNSNDLFGAENRAPTGFGLPPEPSRDMNFFFSPYGQSPVNNLGVSFSTRPSAETYNGSYSFVTARFDLTVLATITYAEPAPISWNSSNDMRTSPELFRAANSDLPMLRLAGADDIQGNAGNDSLFGYGGDDLIAGAAGSDTLNGGDGNDQLFGGFDTDWLFGGNGNDVLDGGGETDIMRGGSGHDRYIVDAPFESVIEDGGEGLDTVEAFVNHTLQANVEDLILRGFTLNGTGNAENNRIDGNLANNSLNGLDGNDMLLGFDGEDRLDGGNGADTMLGGLRNDRYIVDSASDVVTEHAGQGLDTVDAFVNHTLAANVENLVLEGAVTAGTGNTERNRIDGNGGNNSLNGLSGNDLLFGHGGEDLLDGGIDADTMRGGLGNDRYIVENGGDLVSRTAARVSIRSYRSSITRSKTMSRT